MHTKPVKVVNLGISLSIGMTKDQPMVVCAGAFVSV